MVMTVISHSLLALKPQPFRLTGPAADGECPPSTAVRAGPSAPACGRGLAEPHRPRSPVLVSEPLASHHRIMGRFVSGGPHSRSHATRRGAGEQSKLPHHRPSPHRPRSRLHLGLTRSQ